MGTFIRGSCDSSLSGTSPGVEVPAHTVTLPVACGGPARPSPTATVPGDIPARCSLPLSVPTASGLYCSQSQVLLLPSPPQVASVPSITPCPTSSLTSCPRCLSAHIYSGIGNPPKNDLFSRKYPHSLSRLLSCMSWADVPWKQKQEANWVPSEPSPGEDEG
jgi:hypothetical protein